MVGMDLTAAYELSRRNFLLIEVRFGECQFIRKCGTILMALFGFQKNLASYSSLDSARCK